MGIRDLAARLVIRQDRHSIEDLRCFVTIGENNFPVINYSTFGLAVVSNEPFPEGWSGSAQLHIEDVSVGPVDLRWVRTEGQSGDYKIAFEVVKEAINTDRVRVMTEAFRFLGNIRGQSERYKDLSQNFKLLVYDLRDVLTRIERIIKEFESQKSVLSITERESYEQAVLDVLARPMHDYIRNCNLELAKIMDGQSKENVQLGFEFFREQLRDLIYQSPFAERSYKKPLGYAGDFEMMNLIYRNEDFGLSLFGRCMERAMQMHLEPGAVRNRSIYMKEKIHGMVEAFYPRKLKILSVASGPAFEVRTIVKEFSAQDCERVDFHLLDQDLISLKSAQKSILAVAKEQNKKVGLNLIHKPIRQMITEGLGEEKFDFIYSAGLFDYFSDSVARRTAEILFESLTEDGQLIIGNFATSTPNQFGMLTLFDWYLILRSEEDLKRLFTFDDAKLEIESEPNGINLFCILRRK